MTARNDDRLLSAWLHDVAPIREPGHLLGQVLARTARTRRRPAWRIPERWFSMSVITTRLMPAAPVPWRLMAVGAALLIALVVGLVLVASGAFQTLAPPYGLAANGSLIYGVDDDILVADSPGAVGRPLIAGPEQDRFPTVALNGSAIAFLRGPDEAVELWTAGVDGSNPRRVAGPNAGLPSWLDWSPDAQTFAINGFGPTPGSIALVRADGSGSTTIETGLAEARNATFRPTSGGQLSFRGKDANGDWGHYLVNRDGSGMVHLALDPGFQDTPHYAADREFYFNPLTWDSTGTRAAYHTLEWFPDSEAGAGFRVHLAEIDGAGVVTSERTLEFSSEADDEMDPIFIPGTTDIVFRQVEGRTQRIFRGSTDAATRAASNLGVVSSDWFPMFLAPNGREMVLAIPVFVGAEAGTDQVVLLDLQTLEQTEITVTGDLAWQRQAPSAPSP
jgi:hypothetical protein